MDPVSGAIITTLQHLSGQEDILARLWEGGLPLPELSPREGANRNIPKGFGSGGLFLAWVRPCPHHQGLLASGSCSLLQTLKFEQSTQSLGQEVCILTCLLLSPPTLTVPLPLPVPRAPAPQGSIGPSPQQCPCPLFAGHRHVRP